MTDHDLFSTDTAGLTEVPPPQVIQLAHGDRLALSIGPVRKDLDDGDELRGQRDEWSQLPAAFRQSQAMTDYAARPLLIVTAGAGQGAGRLAAQDQFAALSTNSAHRTGDGASHEALLIDRGAATRSARGIRDVVPAVRSGGEMQR
jgi:hypothetical protein